MSLRRIALNEATLRVVKLLTGGGRIEARRLYPAPMHYWLTKPDGFRYAAGLSVDMIGTLLRDQLIAPVVDIRNDQDRFDYLITDRGRAAPTHGAIVYDDEQVDLLGEVA